MSGEDSHQKFYDEHASQARLHEEQRERVTSIILSISGVLVGLVTFAKLSYWAFPSALSITVLGLFGFLFAGKHYERNRYHTKIMELVRKDIERVQIGAGAAPTPLSELRREAEKRHYGDFGWPSFRGSNDEMQRNARSWIARQRLHVFWESVHLIIAGLGLVLCIAIVLNAKLGDAEKPLKVELRPLGEKISIDSNGQLKGNNAPAPH